MYPGIFGLVPFPIIHLPEFIAGGLMGNMFLSEKHLTFSGKWSYGALAFGLSALTIPQGPFTSIVLIGFSALIYLLAKERTLVSNLLSSRLLVFGGSISYSMYLFQIPVRAWVRPLVPDYSRIPWQLAIVPLVLTALSIVVYRYFEDPARRVVRIFFGKLYSISAARA